MKRNWPNMLKRQLLLSILAAAAFLFALSFSAPTAGGNEADKNFRDLQRALEEHGTTVTLASRDMRDDAKIVAEEAEATARTLEGEAGSVSGVYLTVFTVEGQVSSSASVLSGPAVGRFAWAVQFTDLNLYPSSYDALNPAPLHHELIVFIDAVTGKPIMSQTAR